jgi:hypothetical protein
MRGEAVKVGPVNIAIAVIMEVESKAHSIGYKLPEVGKMSTACRGTNDGLKKKHGQCYMLGCCCQCHTRKQ